VGGEHGRRADAAGVTGAIAAPPWNSVGALARPNAFVTSAGRGRQSLAAGKGAVAGPGIASRRRLVLEDGQSTGGSSAGRVDVGRTGDTSSASATPTPTPATTVETVSSTIQPVTQSVQPPQVSIPELPPTPELPPVPSLSLPPPPPLPTLP
jgi:hypothetical protein